jgi:hypothetical protein
MREKVEREGEEERRESLVLGLNLLGLEAVSGNLLVVLLQGREILTGLGELAFLHTLTDVPVDEGTLAVHEVELVVETVPGLGDGGGVAKHGDGAVDRGQGAIVGARRGNGDGLLVVDAELETSWAPLNKVEGRLGLEGGDGSVAVTGDDITTVQEGDSHVLSVAGVADDHLVVGLEAPVYVLARRYDR